jgi:hypothetical protein
MKNAHSLSLDRRADSNIKNHSTLHISSKAVQYIISNYSPHPLQQRISAPHNSNHERPYAKESSKTSPTNPPQSADTNSIAKPTKRSPSEEQNSLLAWDRKMEDELLGLLVEVGAECSLGRILQAARQLEQQWIQSEVEESRYEEMMKASGKDSSEGEKEKRASESMTQLRKLNDSLEEQLGFRKGSAEEQKVVVKKNGRAQMLNMMSEEELESCKTSAKE